MAVGWLTMHMMRLIMANEWLSVTNRWLVPIGLMKRRLLIRLVDLHRQIGVLEIDVRQRVKNVTGKVNFHFLLVFLGSLVVIVVLLLSQDR